MILTYAVGALALLVASFANDIYWFMVSITIAGVGINPYSSLSFILIYESCGQKFGQSSNVALLATFGLGQLIFIFVSIGWKSYQILMLYFIAIPILIQTINFYWIFESPQFFIIKKDFVKAKKIIHSIAKINRRTVGEFTFVEEGKYEKEIRRRIKSKLEEVKANEDDLEKNEKETLEKNRASTLLESKSRNQNQVALFHKTPIFERQMLRIYTFLDLAKKREQFIPMIVISILYFCLYLTYYGALISTPVLGQIYYFNALAQSSAELMGYISANLLIGIIKRK
jgi:MFS family permease